MIVMKKVTIKDIAREANVSVATVSYVLNNRDDQRISEDTRKKVLQIVNLFDYTTNFSAKHISTGKTNIIAVYFGEHDFSLHNAEHSSFLESLSELLDSNGFSVRYVNSKNVKKLDNCDAIICCDSTTEVFRKIGDANYIPLIAVDTIISNDWLFYQINSDLSELKKQAEQKFGKDYLVLTYLFNNDKVRQLLLSNFEQVIFVDSFDEVSQAIKENNNLVVFGSQLGYYCSQYPVNLCVHPLYTEGKLKKILECVDVTVNKKNDIEHNNFV